MKGDLEPFQVLTVISKWATLSPEIDAHTTQDILRFHKCKAHKSDKRGFLAFHWASLMALMA